MHVVVKNFIYVGLFILSSLKVEIFALNYIGGGGGGGEGLQCSSCHQLSRHTSLISPTHNLVKKKEKNVCSSLRWQLRQTIF